MIWLLSVLWAAMLLAPVVLLFVFLPSGRGCPRCGSETLVIRSRLLRPLRRVATLRWCLGCGWQGITRRTTPRPAAPRRESVPEETVDSDSDAPWRQGLGG